MAKSPKSHLLEQLRAQAESVSAKRAIAQEVSREVITRIDRRLHAVFQYLDEACKLLQIIAPPIEHSFKLPQVAHYSEMRLEQAMVVFRKQPLQHLDVYDHVVMYYSLKGPSPPPVRVAMRRSAEVERLLNGANIEFRCETDSNVRGAATHNLIHISAGLRCEVRFDPDFINDSIIVTLRNVDRLEPVILDFSVDALDTPTLDDLVNLVLGKTNQFLLRAPLRGFGR
ncbi:MAG: hypothetical protein ABI981_13910 [Betaproteobacteria bacterium]